MMSALYSVYALLMAAIISLALLVISPTVRFNCAKIIFMLVCRMGIIYIINDNKPWRARLRVMQLEGHLALPLARRSKSCWAMHWYEC